MFGKKNVFGKRNVFGKSSNTILTTAPHSTKTLSRLLLAAGLACSMASQAADLVIAGRDDVYGKALDSTLTRFQQQHPGKQIELLKLPYANLYEKLVISLRENASAYDLMLMDDSWSPEFAGNGWLQPLPENLQSSDFIPAVLNVSRVPENSGPAYSLPVVGNVAMFAYRQDLFDKHQLNAPANWDAVLSDAKTLQQQEPGVSGVVFRGMKGNPIVSGFMPMLWAYGGNVVTNGKASLDSPQALQALNTLKALKAFAPTGVEVYNAADVRQAMEQGKAAMAIEVWPAWASTLDDAAKSNVVGKMTLQPAPGQNVGPSPMLGIWQMAIAKNSQHNELAQQFLSYLTSAENQKALALELGLPPTRRSVYQDAQVVQKYRWYPAQLAALEAGKARPRVRNWQEVESILGDYLQLALMDQMPAQVALQQANQKIAQVLK
ncbi:ABC transporter substrate-binding protein [Dickeya dianthicola]|uniref:ABC transporter substrate-binding protein n=1 Tax=Dickeya dianthicola TaxID=204039 RepID=UPI00136B33BE|nr:ABC transporter substrate-binding protein [Dickeya dianthicola]MCI4238361.1 ABC transporter substrate-binding protein [Dickeya dianthicola]MCI4254324.1 ABC transporter substrate-binding protein [Dickeya dianthicola]MZG22164.1 ABC transporter substrate-binding protein [Dickeya dianthicola]MZI91133.1 ABC transporter substrate-binding protein [Dickeya dianthicola]